MNYIPVDVSCVKKLYAEGRILYDRIHPVESLDAAMDAAIKGRLFMRSNVSEQELNAYLSAKAEIARLQEITLETEKKLLADAEIALADKPFKNFELTTSEGSVLVNSKRQLVAEKSALEELYNKLGEGNELVNKVVSYKLGNEISKALVSVVDRETLNQPLTECVQQIIDKYSLDIDVETFIKKVGKTYKVRVNRMISYWGIDKQSAQTFAYLLEMCENWEFFKELHVKYEKKFPFNQFVEFVKNNFGVNHTVAIKPCF